MTRKPNFLILFLLLLGFQPLYAQELPGIRFSISTDRSDWSKGSATKVDIGIENISDSEVKLPTRIDFQLNDGSSRDYATMANGVFYAPFSFTKIYGPNTGRCQNNLVEKNVKRDGGIVQIFPNRDSYSVKSKEKKEFKIDLQNLCWAHVISSLYPSYEMFSAVNPGSYSLYFSMEFSAGKSEVDGISVPLVKHLESNRLRIEVK